MIIQIFFICMNAVAFDLPNVGNNNQGVKEFNEEKYVESYKDFLKALRADGTNPLYHYNLGNSFEKSGEMDKALSEYESAAQNPRAPDVLKFNSLFNAGNLSVANKNIPKALEYYQKALDLRPDSIEVKTNIELALQQQQGGGGGGDGKDQNKDQNKSDKDKQSNKEDDKKDGKGENDKKQNNQPPSKPTPKPFKSQALNESDVRRILEELKRQEEGIRARQDKKESKQNRDENSAKDW